jgi:hypothetical protein
MLNVIGLFEVKLKAVMLSVEGPFLSIGPNEMICFLMFVLSKYLLPNATAYPSISARDKVVINITVGSLQPHVKKTQLANVLNKFSS